MLWHKARSTATQPLHAPGTFTNDEVAVNFVAHTRTTNAVLYTWLVIHV